MCHVPVINSHLSTQRFRLKCVTHHPNPTPHPHLITSYINHKEHHLFSNISVFRHKHLTII
ncbi:hypothetical protein HanXRQr2_Chr09g0394101 [Helianthus annuus]|uniref:Uncharacterized protein n=1 Tax=Helianthus annuus TaxID=4232 RepID=A0A251TWH2_HELAN|nr:hypothetical protein HanXRQr2_Chr09g0394101 [Helianthus annuus]KAJ0534895.1 hypothetical protein HanIR_Chr09g0424821 [Helianthus annuus]KAJ0893632.1 hypothetical protein HanPSC8_Chr09g0379971 [Helianthus annuus]